MNLGLEQILLIKIIWHVQSDLEKEEWNWRNQPT